VSEAGAVAIVRIVAAGLLAISPITSATSQQDQKPTVDIQILVPASSRHTFSKPDQHWVTRVDYLQKGREESYVIVSAPERGSEIPTFKQISYFEPGKEKDSSAYRRLFRFDPSGHITQEVDQEGGDRFEQYFYPDGSIASFSHWRHGKGIVVGVSVDKSGRVTDRVKDGTGSLVTWIYGPDDYTRSFLAEGNAYVLKSFLDNRPYAISYWLPNGDSLRTTPKEERLTLATVRESWTAPTDGSASGQIWHDLDAAGKLVTGKPGALGLKPPDAIHLRLRDQDRLLWNRRPPDFDRIALQRRKDYQSRRAGFLAAFRDLLRTAGRPDLAPSD